MRYPEGLFKIQAYQYRLYHMTEPRDFYASEDAWEIAAAPGAAGVAGTTSLDPYYVVMKLPGEDREEFVLMVPFTPLRRPNLNGWMAARMDGDNYGELVALSFPRSAEGLDSPRNIAARIEQTDEISRQFSLWEGAGSTVVRGPILVDPHREVDDVRPADLPACTRH